jgi:hypothetical protein
MQENIRKFELACKIIGLVLVIGAIWTSVEALGQNFHQTDYQATLREIGAPKALHGWIEKLERANRPTTWQICAMLLLQSVLPFLLGVYLMKPDNLFCKFTFPRPPADEPQCKISPFDPKELSPVTFKMGHFPDALDDVGNFFDQGDESRSVSPVFK